jgi:hypothetical protein
VKTTSQVPSGTDVSSRAQRRIRLRARCRATRANNTPPSPAEVIPLLSRMVADTGTIRAGLKRYRPVMEKLGLDREARNSVRFAAAEILAKRAEARQDQSASDMAWAEYKMAEEDGDEEGQKDALAAYAAVPTGDRKATQANLRQLAERRQRRHTPGDSKLATRPPPRRVQPRQRSSSNRRPVHVRGSRRSTAAGGGSPGDPDLAEGEPEPPGRTPAGQEGGSPESGPRPIGEIVREAVAELGRYPKAGGGMTCEQCGRKGAAWSLRLGEVVCWDHYHTSFSPEELAEVERIERQRAIARAIRSVVEDADSPTATKLADQALLFETAASVDEVLTLLDRVEALGVTFERRAA